NEASFKIMSWILQYLPIGIFAIISKTVGEQGTDALKSLGSMVGVFYLAIILQLVFYAIILIINRINLKEFFIVTRTPILSAFVTKSTAVTLDLTINVSKKLII